MTVRITGGELLLLATFTSLVRVNYQHPSSTSAMRERTHARSGIDAFRVRIVVVEDDMIIQQTINLCRVVYVSATA